MGADFRGRNPTSNPKAVNSSAPVAGDDPVASRSKPITQNHHLDKDFCFCYVLWIWSHSAEADTWRL